MKNLWQSQLKFISISPGRRRWGFGAILVSLLVGGVFVINFLPARHLPVSQEVANFVLVPDVEASCTLVLNGRPYLQGEEEQTEELTLIITLPDGTPLEGVCITFTRDSGPGGQPEIIGTCTTDAAGRCTILSPGGVINVLFGNTKIGSLPVSNSTETLLALDDAATGGVSYYFPGDEPAEENIVAVPSADGGSIVMEQANKNENGELEPFPKAPGDDAVSVRWRDRDRVDYFPPGWVNFNPGNNTELPTGIVSVSFGPGVLRTGDSYDRAYCYYTADTSGYTRVPPAIGTFLPGGGSFFDLGAVLNGSARPTLILEAETENFDIHLDCWGWQGKTLVKIGTNAASDGRELWLGQPLMMSGGGFNLEYSLYWFGPDREPRNPRLVIPERLVGLVPGADTLGPLVGVNRNRFADDLLAPTNVQLADGLLSWSYEGAIPLGGFRIYRNGYLVGSAPANARSWQGDGLSILECGNPAEFAVTSFIAGQESVPSSAASLDSAECAASVTVTLEVLDIDNLNDCDGISCGTAAEGYGYLVVNDTLISFGGQNNYAGIENKVYNVGGLLAQFSAGNQIVVQLGDTDALNIEFALFDRDLNTADDLLCAVQEVIPARTAEEWLQEDGRRLTRSGGGSEASCNITLVFGVAPPLATGQAETSQ